jgi:hypothetical protein
LLYAKKKLHVLQDFNEIIIAYVPVVVKSLAPSMWTFLLSNLSADVHVHQLQKRTTAFHPKDGCSMDMKRCFPTTTLHGVTIENSALTE